MGGVQKQNSQWGKEGVRGQSVTEEVLIPKPTPHQSIEDIPLTVEQPLPHSQMCTQMIEIRGNNSVVLASYT